MVSTIGTEPAHYDVADNAVKEIMTEEMARRLNVSKRVADSFRNLPGVLGVCVCGSVGLGLADAESDVDISIVVESAIPAPQERRNVYEELCKTDGECDTDILGPGTFDCLDVDGLQVEPEFHILAELNRRIDLALEISTHE